MKLGVRRNAEGNLMNWLIAAEYLKQIHIQCARIHIL